MSVVDLNTRLTNEWQLFNKFLLSSDSLIYLEGKKFIADDVGASLDLSVGDRWYDHVDNTFYQIPEDGIKVGSYKSAVVEVEQQLGLPLNVFGLVTGKGKYIFQGVLISPGKIDPGFIGKLKIVFYNGSKNTITLKPGQLCSSCCFFQTESSQSAPLRMDDISPKMQPYKVPRRKRLFSWAQKNWFNIVTIIISLIAALAAVAALFK